MFMNEREIFLAALEEHMKNKGLSQRSITIYLNRIRRLLEGNFSVNDLCGGADWLWEAYGCKGQLYDPKDHGNTRAAIKHVAELVREKILQEQEIPYVAYDLGWLSIRPKGKYESGYVIHKGMITFSYNVGFDKGKDVVKKLSATQLKKLIHLFERAYKKPCLAASNKCAVDFHGKHGAYAYSYRDKDGVDCACLFEGATSYAEQLAKEFQELLETLRP